MKRKVGKGIFKDPGTRLGLRLGFRMGTGIKGWG